MLGADTSGGLMPTLCTLTERSFVLSADQISSTVLTVLAEFFKTSERTVFWSDELMVNVDPFQGLDGGFFAADWDLKVRVPT